MSSTNLQHSIEERELDLALREAELNRRESALRRAEVSRASLEEGPGARASSVNEDELAERLAALERRERELEQTIEAVESQRLRLEEVRAEYESRRDGLTDRAREVEAETPGRVKENWDRIKREQEGREGVSAFLEKRPTRWASSSREGL